MTKHVDVERDFEREDDEIEELRARLFEYETTIEALDATVVDLTRLLVAQRANALRLARRQSSLEGGDESGP